MLLTFSNQVCDTDLYIIRPNVCMEQHKKKMFLFIVLPKNEESNSKGNREAKSAMLFHLTSRNQKCLCIRLF